MLEKMTKEILSNPGIVYTVQNKAFRHGICKIAVVLWDDDEFVYTCTENLAEWRAEDRKTFEDWRTRRDIRKKIGVLAPDLAVVLVQEWGAAETVRPDGRIPPKVIDNSVDISKIMVFGART